MTSINSNIMNADHQLANNHIQNAKMARLARFANESKVIGKKEMGHAEKARIVKAARGFESIFINNLMKSMKAAMLPEKSDKLGTFGAETLESYADMKLSEQLANTGSGIGIAEMVFEQLTGGQKLSKNPQNVSSENKPLFLPIDSNKNSSDISNDFKRSLTKRIDSFDDIINTTSDTFGVDKNLIKAVISAESAGKKEAVSKAGAKGLMQLMDGTAGDLGVKNSFDPKQNILGGTNYLKQMMDMFGDKEMGLAAYNAGPSKVSQYNGVPPFPETQAYLERVKLYEKMFESLE